MSDDHIYWAAEAKSSDVVGGFLRKRRRFLKNLHASGRASRILSAWSQYYGWGADGVRDTSQLVPTGVRGELVDLATNDFAAIVKQAHVLLTGSPPLWKAIARHNDSFKSRAAEQLADSLCQSYEKHGGLEAAEDESVLTALLCSEAALAIVWNKELGREDPVAVDENGQPVREGDLEFVTLPPWHLCYDVDADNLRETAWFAFRRRMRRYDLAAKRPDLADKLLSTPTTTSRDAEDVWDMRMRPNYGEGQESDYIDVWELRHIPTPALPRGRLMLFSNAECVIFDSIREEQNPETGVTELQDFGYPYRDLGIMHLTAERRIGAVDGHTSFFDLLSLQQGLDSSATAMATAVNAGGLSNWWVQTSGGDSGGDIGVDELAGGLNVIKSPTKPEVIPGAKVDPQAVEFARFAIDRMIKRAGLNDAALGEGEKGMPASLAALYQSQVVQFYSGLQRNVYLFQQAIRTSLVKTLRAFAGPERISYLVGPNKAWTARAWGPEELDPFECVTYEPLGSVLRTQAGRMELADKLLGNGVGNPRQYLTFVTTGRLDPIWDNEVSNLARIQAEKELLQRGIGLPPIKMAAPGLPAVGPDGEPLFEEAPGQEYVRPLLTDPHWLDIPEELAILDAPSARVNPQVTAAVLDVVQYRLKLMRQMDPLLLQLRGCPPELIQAIAALTAPMLPPGSPAPSPDGSTPPPGGQPPGTVAVDAPGGQQDSVKLPKPPKDPATGRREPPPDMKSA